MTVPRRYQGGFGPSCSWALLTSLAAEPPLANCAQK